MENVIKNFINKKKEINILETDRDYRYLGSYYYKIITPIKNNELGFPITENQYGKNK